MTFEDAARVQYRRQTVYTVCLSGPDGEREQVGTTSRKSGTGLLTVLKRDSVQAHVRRLPGAETATLKKTADRLLFSNEWRLEFGGTILQEASTE